MEDRKITARGILPYLMQLCFSNQEKFELSFRFSFFTWLKDGRHRQVFLTATGGPVCISESFPRPQGCSVLPWPDFASALGYGQEEEVPVVTSSFVAPCLHSITKWLLLSESPESLGYNF